jgi:hypothetical protein
LVSHEGHQNKNGQPPRSHATEGLRSLAMLLSEVAYDLNRLRAKNDEPPAEVR